MAEATAEPTAVPLAGGAAAGTLPSAAWQKVQGAAGSGASIARVGRTMPWLPWQVVHSENDCSEATAGLLRGSS